MTRTRRCILPLLLALLGALAVPRPADAAVRRFAMLIGNDRGDAGEEPLAYAEEDARRMRDLLQQYGGVAEPDTLLLQGEDADTVRRRLILLNGQLRQLASDPSVETLLLVFYSGHADAESLHLDGTRLDMAELKGLVTGSPARMRVLVLDACQSGGLTGVKGVRPAPPFALDLDDRLEGEGVAFITSSTAGELSQESSDLQGSFFAHYFMVGLQGVADTNGDGRVTLLEGYSYAAQRTLRATSLTAVGPQHPTYEYDIRGKADVTITDLNQDARQRGTIVFAQPGEYLVFRAAADGPLVGEVLTSQPAQQLVVSPGRYLVRLRAPSELRDQTVFVDAGESVVIEPRGMVAVAYQRLLAKGSFTRGTRHGPVASLLYRGETLDALGGMLMGELSYPVLFGKLWLRPRLLLGGSTFRAGELALKQFELDGEVLLSYGFDLRYVVLLVGGGVGGMYLRQESSAEELGTRSTFGMLVSSHVDVVLPIQAGFYVRVGAEGVGVVVQRDGGRARDWVFQPTFRVGLGLGYTM